MKKRQKQMDTHLHIRIDSETLEMVRKATHTKGHAMSDFIRQALHNEIQRLKQPDTSK